MIVSVPIPEIASKKEVIEALRTAISYATHAEIESVDIRLNIYKGSSVVISSDR